MDDEGVYVSPADVDWRWGLTATPNTPAPFDGMPIAIAAWSAQTINSPLYPATILGANYATALATTVTVNAAGYTVPALPTQGGVNALFSDTTTPFNLDGSIAVGTPFINRLSNTMYT